jgi:hypothetical protein
LSKWVNSTASFGKKSLGLVKIGWNVWSSINL